MAHAFGTSVPGWLVVIPRRHVLALDELTLEESSELGPLLSDLTAALRQVVQCEKTYVALFAKAEGFEHIHFHVIPRRPDLDPAFFGPRVFGLLGGGPALHVLETVRDQIAANLAQALPVSLSLGRDVRPEQRVFVVRPRLSLAISLSSLEDFSGIRQHPDAVAAA